MKRLSVIICTHNPRADYLQRVLDALAVQSLPAAQWELLLIDNASEPALSPQLLASSHPHARLIREDELGLTAARLRGIRESEGDILVYVDDDNVLAHDYLSAVLRLFEAHPFLGAIGPGRLEPEYEVAPAPALTPYLPLLAIRNVACARWSNNTHDRDSVPWGAGLCVTREVTRSYVDLVERMNVDELLDRRGNRLFGNGDVAFSWSAALIGKGFGVFPELVATHLIAARRLCTAHLLRHAEEGRFSGSVTDYLRTGELPGRGVGRSEEWVRLLLRAARRGPLVLRMGLAEMRGTRQARRYIESRRLQPLAFARR
jgi:glycosyltransferase involved in cell wall biosynthesis